MIIPAFTPLCTLSSRHPFITLLPGAIFGLGGALAIFFYQNRNLYGERSDFVLRQLGQTLALNVVYGFVSPRIDNWWVWMC